MIYLRSLIFNVVCYTNIALGCIVTSIVGVFSPKATVKVWNYFFIPGVFLALKYIARTEVEIRGAEFVTQEGVIFASKHQSAMETYCLGNYLKKSSFVMKKELTYIPIFGWSQYFYGMIPIDRSAGSGAMKRMLKAAKDRVSQGRPVVIFPEGTRKQPGAEPDYKPGVMLLYQNLKLPVVPVALNSGLFWAKKSFLRYSGKIVIEFMEPIEPGLNKKEFMEKLESSIENKCAELNAESIANYPATKVNFKTKA